MTRNGVRGSREDDEHIVLQFIELLLIGFGVGTYASLVGVGGGIALVPALLLLYPHLTPQGATGISLAVIFFNAVSASVAYGRRKRIDYRTGFYFAGGTIPGAVLGSSVVAFIPRNVFSGVFGLILISLATFLILRPEKSQRQRHSSTAESENGHRVPHNRWLGLLFGFLIGSIASLLGIGGGIIYVPVMVGLLNFTVHMAVATSLFIIAIMALGGGVTHFVNGVYTGFFHVIGLLALGTVLGAQFGARLSDVLKGRLIIRLFALALLAVGVRLCAESF